MGLMRRNSSKDPTLLSSVGDNLTENSKIVKNIIDTSKKIIVPVSKVLDYLAVSVITLVVYKLAENYI
jgi:hypothetical protein